MEIFYSKENITPLEKSILTVGSYDGLHRGHQEILKTVVKKSKTYKIPSVLVTFNPHPRMIIKDNFKKLSLIRSLDQKLKIIEDIGIDIVYIITFSKKFSNITALDFMSKIIVPNFGPKAIVTGSNHYFGRNRVGSPSFLKNYGQDKHIEIIVIKPIMDDKSQISSSNIRSLIRLGNISKANIQLNIPFTISGTVVQGSGRGASLTFQTANIKPKENNQLFPKNGVYLVLGRIVGLNTYGMCNLGVRPTFGENKLVMEVHLFHEKELNLYGERIEIEFLERIRDERKFPSSKELIKQLKIDKLICLGLLNKYQ